MLFEKYRVLPRTERALKDVEFIIYHFYVASVTLVAMGVVGALHEDPAAYLAVFFGGCTLVAGVAIKLTHRALLKGSSRTAYLNLISTVMGSHNFPLLPMMLTVFVVASTFLAFLYILLN